jgi:hypothetical protein
MAMHSPTMNRMCNLNLKIMVSMSELQITVLDAVNPTF